MARGDTADDGGRDGLPSPVVAFLYRRVGLSHVFTACGIDGVYLGGSSLRGAYASLGPGLSEYVSEALGRPVNYGVPDFATSFGSGEDPLEGTLVVARLLDLAPPSHTYV